MSISHLCKFLSDKCGVYLALHRWLFLSSLILQIEDFKKFYVHQVKSLVETILLDFSLLYHNHSLDGLAFIHVFISLINLVQAIAMGEDSAWIDIAIKNSF